MTELSNITERKSIVRTALVVLIFAVIFISIFSTISIFVFKENNLSENGLAFALDRASRGAVCIEWTTKKVLYGEGENNKTFPASTTKILTALVVLENLQLNQKIKIPKEAVGIEGSSLYLREGEMLTVEDLLYGMMLRSGNDAAVALAIAVSGNITDFAKKMNEMAVDCGAVNSNFENPHGLHHPNHYTTAYDLALITAEAMKNQYFRTIISMQKARIGEGESARVIANKNKMLHLYDGANGVKTGYTKNSGRCLVSSAKRNGMQLIAVVLNHGDMWGDSMSILDYGFDNYMMVDTELLHLYGDYGKSALDDMKNNPSFARLTRYPVPKIALYNQKTR